jgi:ADP-L-glycero-D-manno-heptose 6-epimerase
VIVVTGGAGFIGSNLVHALAGRGESVVVVDDLKDGRKFANIVDADVADYLDFDGFYQDLAHGGKCLDGVRAVFHQGACSDTTEWDGRYVMRLNYEHSRTLLAACLERELPLIYASSAAIYGAGTRFAEQRDCERPINLYGYSKHLFDRHVLRRMEASPSQVVGLRYFNVYGPREDHKDRMASVARHLHRQVSEEGEARLFQGSGGYGDGEQRRDFVYVDDVVKVNLWFLDQPGPSGIYNVGTGRSQSFNDVAKAVIGWHGHGRVRYVPFPEDLQGRYQSFTEADLGALREAGYTGRFLSVEDGVARYLDWLDRERRRRNAGTDGPD